MLPGTVYPVSYRTPGTPVVHYRQSALGLRSIRVSVESLDPLPKAAH
jgi:hypothetical protein